MPEYPKNRGEVKMHNKGRVSVLKDIIVEKGWGDGKMFRWVEPGPGTLILEPVQKQTGYRSFQA